MVRYQFPSADFPAVPSIALDADATWRSAQGPAGVMTLVKEGSDSGFVSNVVVTVNRHAITFDLSLLFKDLETEAAERHGDPADPVFEAQINGRAFLGQVIVFVDDLAGTLAQLHLATRVDHGESCDVVHLVGTCAGDRVNQELPMLNEVMGTVSIASGSGR